MAWLHALEIPRVVINRVEEDYWLAFHRFFGPVGSALRNVRIGLDGAPPAADIDHRRRLEPGNAAEVADVKCNKRPRRLA